MVTPVTPPKSQLKSLIGNQKKAIAASIVGNRRASTMC
jgi:hypothetical protein